MPIGVYQRTRRRRARREAIYVIGPSIAYIPLTRGFYACVDSWDAPWMSRWTWTASVRKRGVYPVTCLTGKGMQYMHRFLFILPRGMCVDHKNNNPLHNWTGNIRPATAQQNNQNSRIKVDNKSGFKGVYWSKAKRKYVSQITHNGITRHVGSSDSAYELHIKYQAMALALRGEFSFLSAA